MVQLTVALGCWVDAGADRDALSSLQPRNATSTATLVGAELFRLLPTASITTGKGHGFEKYKLISILDCVALGPGGQFAHADVV